MVFQISEKKKLQLSKVAKFLAAMHILEGHFKVKTHSIHLDAVVKIYYKLLTFI